MFFPCLILVNNSLLPTRVFTSYRIKPVVLRMILFCDVVFGLVYICSFSHCSIRDYDVENECGVLKKAGNRDYLIIKLILYCNVCGAIYEMPARQIINNRYI